MGDRIYRDFCVFILLYVREGINEFFIGSGSVSSFGNCFRKSLFTAPGDWSMILLLVSHTTSVASSSDESKVEISL